MPKLMHRIVAYTFLNVCEKITSFCQALKRCTQKKWFGFSASRCIQALITCRLDYAASPCCVACLCYAAKDTINLHRTPPHISISLMELGDANTSLQSCISCTGLSMRQIQARMPGAGFVDSKENK